MVTIQETCTGCGLCIEDCVAGVLSLRDGRAHVGGSCIECGHCAAVCPAGAPLIPGCGMADMEPADAAPPLDPAALLHAVKFRRSIRRYEPRDVEREKLEYIIQAGRYTATAVNRQDLRFIVVQEHLRQFKTIIWDGLRALLEQGNPDAQPYAEMYRQRLADPAADFLFRNAPAVLYISCERAWDAGMAAQNMELAAAAQGLGVLYNGFLRRAAAFVPGAAEWLGADRSTFAACMLLGYPAVRYRRSAPRRAADVIWK